MKFDTVSNADEGSISPRILFSHQTDVVAVRRRLEPSFSDFTEEVSPVSFASASASASVARGGDETCAVECGVGECAICYLNLPLRANHIFTMCGHLYCVRCLLKWWDTSTTCPICRAELFADAELDADVDGEADSEADVDADADAEEQQEQQDVAADSDADAEYEDYEVAADSDTTDEDEEDVEDTLFNRYLRQDRFFERIYYTRRFICGNSDEDSDGDEDQGGAQDRQGGAAAATAAVETAVVAPAATGQDYDRNIRANYDDTIQSGPYQYSLANFEIHHLRKNRKIAMNLYGRMVFREMLLSQQVEFRGDVRYCDDAVIPKSDWHQLLTRSNYQRYSDTINIIMYEFVIRRGSAISPLYELNLFGTIKDIRVVVNDDEYDTEAHGYDWEELHEYAFVADVFTASPFCVNWEGPHGRMEPQYKQYGSYDMTEGIISPTELVIPFTQIRRLYRIRGIERIAYNIGAGE